MESILIIDDKINNLRHGLETALEHYELEFVESGRKALATLKKRPFALALLDIKMPPDFAQQEEREGLEVLRAIKKTYPGLPVVMLTVLSDIDLVVDCIKAGAFHYITKPVDLKKLREVVEAALEQVRLRQHADFLQQVVDLRDQLFRLPAKRVEENRFGLLLGCSEQMHTVFEQIQRYAQVKESVLITGETGTGKELVARELHLLSPRAHASLVPVNCPAISESLMESELFGHKKGAFTGAVSDKKGLLEEANGGTVFLDEIGDMPLHLQPKLLRFLQDGTVYPVGSTVPRKLDVRVISATNRDLKRQTKNGKFREDLYYRLNVLSIAIAPLRERPDDIELLATYFLEKYSEQYSRPIPRIDEETLGMLKAYAWPGNVRQLESVIKSALLECARPVLKPEHVVLNQEPAKIEGSVSVDNLWERICAGELRIDDLTTFRNTYGSKVLKEIIVRALRQEKSVKAAGKFIGYLEDDPSKAHYDNLRKWMTRLGISRKR